MKRLLFILAFGLLPLWGGAVFLVVSGALSSSPDYWNVAPWLLIAAIPWCGPTFGIALATVAVLAMTPGTPARKMGAAVVCFAVLAGTLAFFVYQGWRGKEKAQVQRLDEQALVKQFVASHPAVLDKVGPQPRVSVAITRLDAQGQAFEYDVYVQTVPSFSAIVSVTRAAENPTLTLRCITTVPSGRRQSGADWCAEGVLPLNLN